MTLVYEWLMLVLAIDRPGGAHTIEIGAFPGAREVVANLFHHYDGGLERLGGYGLGWPTSVWSGAWTRIRLQVTFGGAPSIAAWANGEQTLPVTPISAPFVDGRPSMSLGIGFEGVGGPCAMRYDNVLLSIVDAP